ncbi:MAG: UDP-glucose 4-epimerase GalE [Oscillospiraceae bacterium]|nr:UDP-glucose 4-epimerase GalE [Oscillospiraceae bacterium]MBQ8595373.1 UDP-glucose 4-epimerase GalE [Oscillospiraceae bacterium]
MKILLTGGAGYIGSHTAVELSSMGYDVVIADNFSNSNPIVLEKLEKITGKCFPLYKIDVADKAALRRVFEENEIEAVIHFAGYKAVGESVKVPLSYYRSNIDTTLSLIEIMEEFGCKNLVFSSSATVYGKRASLPYSEEMETGPCTNPYGWTKLFIEQIITDYAKANPDFSAVILRYFNPVGAHKSGLIGEDPNGIPNNLVPYISRVAVGNLPYLNVFGNDYPTADGTGVRDYIHVTDLAKGHVAAIDFAAKNSGTEIFNLGTGNGISVLEMVKAYEKACGHEIPYRIAPRREGDIAFCFANAKKAFEILGWKTEFSVDEMCRDSWNWQSKNPDGYK